jgi:hypothetical protein
MWNFNVIIKVVLSYLLLVQHSLKLIYQKVIKASIGLDSRKSAEMRNIRIIKSTH